MQILTNSFPIAEHLLRNSKNTITLPGGAIYREQNIILSPFENDVTRNFYARRMFMSAQGVSPIGVMEGDPLLIQAEQKLINQAEELVLLVDSSKFASRSSLILCPLERGSQPSSPTIPAPAQAVAMLREAGVAVGCRSQGGAVVRRVTSVATWHSCQGRRPRRDDLRRYAPRKLAIAHGRRSSNSPISRSPSAG